VCSAARSNNFYARIKGLTFYLLGMLLPLLLIVNLVARSMSRDVLDSFLGSSGTEALLLYLVSVVLFLTGTYCSSPQTFCLGTLPNLA